MAVGLRGRGRRRRGAERGKRSRDGGGGREFGNRDGGGMETILQYDLR